MSQADLSGGATPAGGASASNSNDFGFGASGAGGATSAADAASLANDSGDDSLLTRQDGGQSGEQDSGADAGGDKAGKQEAKDGQKPDGNKASDPLMQVPATADDYQITFADGVDVNNVTLNSFKAKAHELGIPQGQAQKLVDFYVQNESQRTAAHFQAAAEMKQDWEQQIMSSPTFRKDAGDARKTLVTFGSFGTVNEKGEPAIHPEIKGIFDESLVGSHPKVFQMFVDIGKALAEPEARGRGVGGGKEKPLADRLWPNMK